MEERQSRWSSMVWKRLHPYLCARIIPPNSMFSNFCHVLKSMANKPSATDISTFISAEDANSYLVLTAGWKAWMRDDREDDYDTFLHKFLAGSNDLCIYNDDKGCWAITKRYPMQRFSSQKEADKVLSDFGKIVKDNTGIELFKK